MKKIMKVIAMSLSLVMVAMFCSCEPEVDTPDSPTNPTNPTNPTDPTNPATVGFDENGASNAVFSVAENKTVHFSRGNLQYQASTGTWRFAEHQYDIIGRDNGNISSTYSGWIDLFRWGTSGWNSGAVCYQPWSNGYVTDYWPGGDYTNDLTGECANADWGVYNRISNGGNQTGMWRTLTKEEWYYLLFTRSASTVSGKTNARFAKASIGGITGLIVFPDSYTVPTGLSIEARSINSKSAESTTNTYTAEQWSQLESAGALFMPCAGYLYSTAYGQLSTGFYWSSSHTTNSWAYSLEFSDYQVRIEGQTYRNYGLSVRLVKN